MLAINPTRSNHAHLERVMEAKLIQEGFVERTPERALLAKRMAGARRSHSGDFQ